MVNITVLTSRSATLSMNDPNIGENATKLLLDEKLAFYITYQEISEHEYVNGFRNSSIALEIKDLVSPSLILQGLFLYHGSEKSTASHLHINRYVGVPHKHIHFVTVWSDRTSSFCEFFIHDYDTKTSNRFIP